MEFYDKRDSLHELEAKIPNVDDIREKTELQNFYTDKTILITGGSGFLGLLLIEKLLRTCGDLKNIILLLREKRGKSVYERVQTMFDDEVFDKMKRQNREYRKKIQIICGCCEKPNLGVEDQTIARLQAEVDVIFHSAATVRFDEHIRTAYEINVNGTKTLLEIAKGMKNLKAFVYVSTLYCQSHLSHIDEKFYPGALTEEEMKTLLDSFDYETLAVLTPKLLNGRFNTYTMTKAIAEDIVSKCKWQLPVAVFRPSIVTATISEPLTCWTNNIYGATGVFVGSGIGFLRTLYCDPNCKAEIIPADRCINGLIAVPLHIQKNWYNPTVEKRPVNDPIFNFAASQNNVVTWDYVMRTMTNLARGRELAIDSVIWNFHLSLDGNRLLWLIKYYLYHILPVPIFLIMEKVAKQKPRIWKGYVKLYRFTYLYSFFMIKSWKITTSNTCKLYEQLDANDKILFNCDTNMDWNHYLFNMSKGLGRYILKYDWNDEQKAIKSRIRIRTLYIIDKILIWLVRILFAIYAIKLVIKLVNYVLGVNM